MTDHEHPDDQIEWPREIWMGEREEYDQGVVTAVLSEHATVARWEGDKERDREFHRYVDADIHESAERYYKARIAAAEAAAYRKAADARGLWLQFNSEGEPIGYCTVQPHDPGGMKQYVSRDAILALADQSALDEAIADEREKCAKLNDKADELIARGLHKCLLTVDEHYGWPDGLSIPLNDPDTGEREVVAHLDHEDSGIGPALWDFAISVLKERAAIRKGDQA